MLQEWKVLRVPEGTDLRPDQSFWMPSKSNFFGKMSCDFFFFFFFFMFASIEEVKCSLLFLFSLCSFSLPPPWSTSKLWITEFWVFMEVSLGGSLGWIKEARQSQSPTHAQTHHDPALQFCLSHFSLSVYVLWFSHMHSRLGLAAQSSSRRWPTSSPFLTSANLVWLLLSWSGIAITFCA